MVNIAFKRVHFYFGIALNAVKALFLTILLILSLSTNVQAREDTIRFDHISVEQGLSQHTLRAILQDQDGFMWFGTENGLNKYDGYEFTVYTHNPSESSSLTNNIIQALCEDQAGVLWIGTYRGLNTFDRTTETFVHYQHDPDNPDSLSYGSVTSIYEDHQEVLWIGTYRGLNKFDRGKKTFAHYRHDPANPQSLSSDRVSSISEDGAGVLWIGTADGGLNRFDRTAETFTRYRHDPANSRSLSSDSVSAIYEDREGMLWIGTSDGGLNTFDRPAETFSHYRYDPDNPRSLSSDSVSSLVEYGEGTLWIGTDGGGLNAFDRSTGTFTHYKNLPYDSQSLSGNHVVSLFEDRGGVFWIGTEGGLNKFNRLTMKTFMKHYTHNPRNPNSLSDNNISSIYEDQEGVLWIGTIKGLNKFERETETFGHYPGLGDSHVSTTYEDREKTFWIGTFGDGLNKFDRDTGTLTSSYKHHPDDSQSLSHNTVTFIYEDQTGDLWIGTFGGGLNKFDRNKNIFTHYRHNPDDPQSLSNDSVWSIHEDRQGILWIGTWGGGLNRFDREQDIFTHYRNDPANPQSLGSDLVWSIYEDRQGILWIGTQDGGLNRFDRQTETFTPFTKKSGLASNSVHGILEDKAGNLWLSTSEGLSKFDIQRKTFKNYNEDDGLQQGGLKSAVCQSRSGEMFFGGNNGVNAFYPDRIQDNPHTPSIVLTAFKTFVQGKLVEQPISKTGSIELSYDNSSFYFEFVALDYTEPGKNQYKYMLEGIDQDWVIADATRRFAQYTELGDGGYTFRVQGSNSDGIWNEKGRTIQVRITPPWWQTWWGITLIISVVVAGTVVVAIVGVSGYAISQNNARKHAEKAVDRLRAVNEVGRRLTSGIRLSEQKILELIHEQARLLMDTQNVYVTLYDPEQHMLIFPEVKDGKPARKREIPRTRRIKDETEGSPTERAVLEKEALFIPDLQEWYQEHNIEFPYEEPSPKSWLGIPMIFEDKVLGVVTLWNNDKKPVYEQDDLEVLRMMANQAAIALENARLYNKLGEALTHVDLELEQRMSELTKSNEELRELDRRKSEFLSTVSHELRTPLAPIKSCIENMLEQMYGPITEKQHNRLKRALGRANEESRLIENLLDLVRIQEGRVKLDVEYESMTKIVADVIQVFEYNASKEQIELQTEFPEENELKTQLDRGKIKQVLSNLVGNAIKFTPAGGTITVSVSSDDKWIRAQINDTGIGIPESELEKIFDRFYQVDSSLTRKVGGTGIGLNIAQKYIELHKGKIWAKNRVDKKGATFTFTLPKIDHKTDEIHEQEKSI